MSGCLDEISLDTPGDPTDLIAIQGKLIAGSPAVVEVTLSKLFIFTGLNKPAPVFNAAVFLENEAGASKELIEPIDNKGFFSVEIPDNDPDFSVDIDNSYKLIVILSDGKRYESAFESVNPVPEATELKWKVVQKLSSNLIGTPILVDYLQFSISTPVLPDGAEENARLLWQAIGTYKMTDTPNGVVPACPYPNQWHPDFVWPSPKTCYVFEELSDGNIDVFNGRESNQTHLIDIPIYDGLLDFRFAEGFYLTVYQQALTADAFTYWKHVGQAIDRSGDMFETPAGKIRSNFTNLDDPDDEVFGYFYATTQDTIRMYIDSVSVGQPTTYCPPPPPNQLPPFGGGLTTCCDCLIFPGATPDKPSWWEE